MVLPKLFEHLMERKTFPIFTSNQHPQDLYSAGLARKYFLPFQRLITEHCAVLRVGAADPASVVDLPKVMATMERVIQLDETTYFGNAHVILGVAKAALPKALGGDPDGAKEHFLQAQRLTDGKYIMTDFLYARFYLAQAVQDEDGFTETLEAILEAEDDTFPEQRLAQEIAKVRAQYWLDHTDELF